MLKIKFVLIIFTLAFGIFSCGTEGGGSTSSENTPEQLSKSSDSLELNLTIERVPNLQTQINSYFKIIKALEIPDFDFIQKEYPAGGLKLVALAVDTEFKEFTTDFTLESTAKNTGFIGFDERLRIDNISIPERKEILDISIKKIMIFTMIADSNRLVENSERGIQNQDAFGKNIIDRMFVFFYGNREKNIDNLSIANALKKFDEQNQKNIFPTIENALNKIESNINTDINEIRISNQQITIAFYKYLYFSTLNKIALAEDANANKQDFLEHLVGAEFSFHGIRNITYTNNQKDDSLIERMLGDRNFSFIDYDKFESIINRGIAMTALKNMKPSIENLGKNDNNADLTALSSSLFLDIISSSYENKKHSRKTNDNLISLTEKFMNAIKGRNRALASSTYNEISNITLK